MRHWKWNLASWDILILPRLSNTIKTSLNSNPNKLSICKKWSSKIETNSTKSLKTKFLKENSIKKSLMILESKSVSLNLELPWWLNNIKKNFTVWAHRFKWHQWLLSDRLLKRKNILNNHKLKKDIFNKLSLLKINRLRSSIIR